jgi:ubiquinone/menaquinone biosynthesis C-methylase UbiE
MAEYVLTATKTRAEAGSYYDRIVKLYDLTFKLNGYGRSLDQYFEEHPLPVFPGARVLDAGCGTGTLTLALLRTLVKLTALDLSASSMAAARKYVNKDHHHPDQKVHFAQANILSLPFTDESFDLIVTSGVLDYVPLDEGFTELARVIARGGHLLHLPMRRSPVTKLLELLFRFKAHSPDQVTESSAQHFQVVSHYRFPPFHVIAWSKTAVLAQKI